MIKFSLNTITNFIICLFLLLLPFQVWGTTIFPAQTGKILFSAWAFPVILILLALIFIRSKSLFRIKVSKTDMALLLFILFLVLHLIVIQPVEIHPFIVAEFLVITALYLLVRWIKAGSLLWIFAMLLIAALGQSVMGLLQYFSVLPSLHGEFDITGTFFNPAPFAGYLAALLPMAVGGMIFLSRDKSHNVENRFVSKWKSTFIYIILLISGISVLVLILAKSRAALLAASVSCAFLLVSVIKSGIISKQKIGDIFLIKKLFNSRLKRILSVVILAAVITVAGFKLYQIRPASVEGRMLIWKSAARMVVDNPVKGVGAGQYKAHYMHYQAAYLQNNHNSKEQFLADNSIFAFNEFLKITCELGIPGLAMSLLILFTVFYEMPRAGSHNFSSILARAGIASIVMFGLFSYPGSVFPIKVLFAVFLAVVARNQKQFQVNTILNKGEHSKVVLQLKAVIVIVSMVLSVSYFQKVNQLTVACKEWKKAFNQFKSDNPGSIEKCKKVYPALKNDGFFMAMYGNFLLRSEKYIEAEKILDEATKLQPTSNIYLGLGDCYLKRQKYNKAEKAYRYALQMVPSRIKPVYALANLYMQTNREKAAKHVIENYLLCDNKKRTLASYEIELQLNEIIKEINDSIKFDL